MGEAIEIAEAAGLTLALEPETANVVKSVGHARDLLAALRAPCLKVVIDPANLIDAENVSNMRVVIQEAIDLLAPDIVLAHAKDIDGQLRHVAAGKGLLDYDCYLANLRKTGFRGPLIVHGLEESEVSECLAFLRSKLAGS